MPSELKRRKRGNKDIRRYLERECKYALFISHIVIYKKSSCYILNVTSKMTRMKCSLKKFEPPMEFQSTSFQTPAGTLSTELWRKLSVWSPWTLDLSHSTTEPKIYHLYLFIVIQYALDTASPNSMQAACHMSPVNGLANCDNCVWEVMGSTRVGHSNFFFVLRLWHDWTFSSLL